MTSAQVSAALRAARSIRSLIAAAQLIQHIEPIGERMRAEEVFANQYHAMKGKQHGNVPPNHR